MRGQLKVCFEKLSWHHFRASPHADMSTQHTHAALSTQGWERPRGIAWAWWKSQDLLYSCGKNSCHSLVGNIPNPKASRRGSSDGLEWTGRRKKLFLGKWFSLILFTNTVSIEPRSLTLSLSLSQHQSRTCCLVWTESETWSLFLVLPTDSRVTSVTSSPRASEFRSLKRT